MTNETSIRAPSLPTVVARFWERVEQQPDRPALRAFENGRWTGITWASYGSAVATIAAGLGRLGVDPGDRVGILAGNQPAWHAVDMAVLSIGAVTVPVYSTSSSSQVAHILGDSGAKICVVDSNAQLAKVLLHREQLPALERIVTTVPLGGLDLERVLTSLDSLSDEATGGDHVGRPALGFDIGPDDVATLVYTSGTTGPPKGVTLTHGNLAWTLESVQSVIGLSPDDRFISYLPLSHIAERVTSHFGQIVAGGETWFARSLASLPEDMRACRPTVFFAVPRVWQKLRSAITEQATEMPWPAGRIVERYLAKGEPQPAADGGGLAALARRAANATEHVAFDQTVGRALRRKLGLDRARYIVSSAAPIHPDLLHWFANIGVPIAEVWGQTEDCGPATLNPPDDIRIGTVGQPIPGLEVRVADDGELLVRGDSVCAGYHDKEVATAKLIDPDGWMSTGDLGSIDSDGFVTITGRKKDLIINAAGKNISPSEIETRLSMEPLIGQAVVVGDGRRYLVALISLDADDAAAWAERHGILTDLEAIATDPGLREEVAASVDRVNSERSPVEQIKHWRLLREPLSVDRGELTPTLKVRRAVVADHFAHLIDEMYATS